MKSDLNPVVEAFAEASVLMKMLYFRFMNIFIGFLLGYKILLNRRRALVLLVAVDAERHGIKKLDIVAGSTEPTREVCSES